MARLIDADALLEDLGIHLIRSGSVLFSNDVLTLITNAPTVQREGWVRVEELQRLYDEMFRHKDIAISANSLFKLINHE